MVKFSEENKIDQLNKAAEVLQIPSTNNLIHHQFYRSNSWIIISFKNQEKLDSCIKAIDTLKDNNIKLIDISGEETYSYNKNNKQIYRNKSIGIQEEEKITKGGLSQYQEWAYTLTDIPLDLNNNKIKEALKPFRKISDLQIKQKGKWKSASFTIQQLEHLYSLDNRWAISLKNNMARVISKDNFLQTPKERNNFSA